MEISQSQATDNTAKPKVTSFFPLRKLKGTQAALKTPAMCLVHLGEESAGKDEEVESEEPNSINGVTENSWCALKGLLKTPR